MSLCPSASRASDAGMTLLKLELPPGGDVLGPVPALASSARYKSLHAISSPVSPKYPPVTHHDPSQLWRTADIPDIDLSSLTNHKSSISALTPHEKVIHLLTLRCELLPSAGRSVVADNGE